MTVNEFPILGNEFPVSGNTFTPNINLIGSNTITYTYTSGGCTISATQDLVVNESPFVDPINVTTSNPTCFGYFGKKCTQAFGQDKSKLIISY